MKCQAIQLLLPLFVEGDLPRRKSERVRRHLDGCPACRGLGDQYRVSQQWLRGSFAPAIEGETLESLRRTVWRRLEQVPRPAPWWLAIERGWAALRRWSSQPAVAVAAVGLVVLGSVSVTRMAGLGGSQLGVENPPQLEQAADESGPIEAPDDPETILAAATLDEMADGTEPGEAESTEESAANNMRIEIQTQDPNVRIIWFTPPAAEAAPVED